jgi:uridylate kinase
LSKNNIKTSKRNLKLVIKIGRYVFSSNLDTKMLSLYAELFRKLRREGHKIVIVTGGGEEARKYISAAKGLGGSEFTCDTLGIDVSRLNAKLLIAGLGDDVYPFSPPTLEELQKAFESGKIIVMGGLQPGQSTNAVAALAAEAIHADLFINATNIDGVYTADPKKDPNAKKLDIISAGDFLKLSLGDKLLAGQYELFDPLAIKIVERSRIPTRIIDGRTVENIERAVKNESVGTLICFT